MPCRDYSPDEGQSVRHKLDQVTKMLCGVMRHVEAGTASLAYTTQEVPGLGRWWEDHKEADRREAERTAKELARKKADLRDRIRRDQADLKRLEGEG